MPSEEQPLRSVKKVIVAPFLAAAPFHSAIFDEFPSFAEASVNTNIGLPYLYPSSNAFSIPINLNSGQSPPPVAVSPSMSDTNFESSLSFRQVRGPVPNNRRI